MKLIVLICFFSIAIGALGAWVIMRYGVRLGVNDIPSNRSSHFIPISKGAGIGILFVFVTTSIFLDVPFGFWLSALIVGLVGFWGGDKHHLSPKARLFIQFICSFVCLFYVAQLNGSIASIILFGLLLSIFIVGTSNFYNFMDGIDGIAGITAVVAFSLMAFYAHQEGAWEPYGILCMAIVFSSIGFLFFNMPTARVFLGDIGSITLGFVFSCLVVILSENFIDFLVMAGFISTFYFDELFTMILRIRNKDSLMQPHRKHIYQLLVNEISVSHWKIALLYGIVQLIAGIIMISLKSKGLYFIFTGYLVIGLLMTFLAIRIHQKAALK